MVVFPISYFGSVRYFQELAKHSEITFEVYDHFPKQTYRNRAVILSSQGRQTLTVPVIKENGTKTLTKDIRVSTTENWSLIHWRAIQTAYASAPYFEHYASNIQELISKKHTFLIDLNTEILRFFIKIWQLSINFNFSTCFEKTGIEFTNFDFENEPMQGNYTQVLFQNQVFDPSVSILDLLFCEGPMGKMLLDFQ